MLDQPGQPDHADGGPIVVENLTMAYGSVVIQRDVSFTVATGEVFVIMGASGCGKSTLLRHLVGLKTPASGRVFLSGTSMWETAPAERERLLRRCGILYQGGALWSSMTLGENISLPLEQFTDLSTGDIRDLVATKLALVGLAGFEAYFPDELSNGMRKRAAFARAMALEPDILFFDEPSAGLDPVSAQRLDDLILQVQQTLGTTIVVVTHELASIFAIATRALFLDAQGSGTIALGPPKDLLAMNSDARVRTFLTRGGTAHW